MEMLSNITLTKNQLIELVPDSIVTGVLNILKTYDTAYIVREYGNWSCSTGVCIKNEYALDHLFYMVKASDVYSHKERLLHYINEFKDYPCTNAIKRDYATFRGAINAGKQAVDIDTQGNIIWA